MKPETRILVVTSVVTAMIASATWLKESNVLPQIYSLVGSLVQSEPELAKENVTVFEYRRGRGGYKTLGDVAQKAAALGFKTQNWISKGMVPGAERGWGVPPSQYDTAKGGIYYPKHLESYARLIQSTITRENPALKVTVPLIPVDMSDEYVFVGPKTVAQHSILVYAPG